MPPTTRPDRDRGRRRITWTRTPPASTATAGRARASSGKPDQTARRAPTARGRVALVVGLGPAAAVDAGRVRGGPPRGAGAGSRPSCAVGHRPCSTSTRPAADRPGPQAAGRGRRARLLPLYPLQVRRPRADRLLEVASSWAAAAQPRRGRGRPRAPASPRPCALARDLVNTPGGTLTAPALAEQAAEIADARRTWRSRCSTRTPSSEPGSAACSA